MKNLANPNTNFYHKYKKISGFPFTKKPTFTLSFDSNCIEFSTTDKSDVLMSLEKKKKKESRIILSVLLKRFGKVIKNNYRVTDFKLNNQTYISGTNEPEKHDMPEKTVILLLMWLRLL